MTLTTQAKQDSSEDIAPLTLSTASGRQHLLSLIWKIILWIVGILLYIGSSIWLPVGLNLLTLSICDKINPLGDTRTRVNRLLEGRWLLELAMASLVLSTSALVVMGMISLASGYCPSLKRANKKDSRNPRYSDKDGVIEAPPPYIFSRK
jgi:hypothetical protein